MPKNRHIPFGYMMRDGKIVINPAEADAVKYIGENKYPSIIAYEDFFTAQSMRGEKKAGWKKQSSYVKWVKSIAVCRDCGAQFLKDTSTAPNSPLRRPR